MSMAEHPDPIREEVFKPTSRLFCATTAVDVTAEETVADVKVERPSDCLASPSPSSAMGSGSANTLETNCIKRGGKAAETAEATIEEIAS